MHELLERTVAAASVSATVRVDEHQDELVNALNHPEVEYAKESRGFKAVQVFHQTTPIEALILVFEADNLEAAFDPRHQDHASLEKRRAFWSQVAGMTGPFMPELPELLVDWHHEHGHRHKAPARAPNGDTESRSNRIRMSTMETAAKIKVTRKNARFADAPPCMSTRSLHPSRVATSMA